MSTASLEHLGIAAKKHRSSVLFETSAASGHPHTFKFSTSSKAQVLESFPTRQIKMSTYRVAGPVLAGVCGVLIAYTTLRPELEAQQAERLGETHPQPAEKKYDTVISDQMREDFREAGKELGASDGGFAWGIRKMFSKGPDAGEQEQRVDSVKDVEKKT